MINKLIILANIIFIIASIILFVLLMYIGISKAFTIKVVISSVVILIVGICSIVELLKLRSE